MTYKERVEGYERYAEEVFGTKETVNTRRRQKQIEEVVNEVVDAWVIEGRAPMYHRLQKDRLRREWRTLARAVEKLVVFDAMRKAVLK